MTYEIHNMDCRVAMAMLLAPDSVDSIVCDPPYELSFMGRKWDSTGVAFDVNVWREALRVLRPGGHLLAFSGTRTYHRMACAIEDAGFEVRDCISWNFGSGFPKAEVWTQAKADKGHAESREMIDAGFEGWARGGLKPAYEPVIVATKPLPDETERRITLSNLSKLRAQVWLMLSAMRAEILSPSSQSESAEAYDTAQWTAADVTNTLVDLSGQTDMSLCASEANTLWSTVSSWPNILAGLSKPKNMCTTGIISGQTIDWKTLSYCSSAITPVCIMTALTNRAGGPALVSIAAQYFLAELKRLTLTHELSALAPAIEKNRRNSLAVGDSCDTEMIVVARKPLAERTVAANVLAWGTGGLNIDACRVGTATAGWGGGAAGGNTWDETNCGLAKAGEPRPVVGRFPPNLIHDGSDEVVACFPSSAGQLAKASTSDTLRAGQNVYGVMTCGSGGSEPRADTGSAARFFPSCPLDDEDVETQRLIYCAKASRADRDEGLGDLPARAAGMVSDHSGQHITRRDEGYVVAPRANHHATVKPTALMRHLVRLVTPPGGTVLDPFTGSGSTGKAAILEGFNFIGCELDADYVMIAEARCAHASL